MKIEVDGRMMNTILLPISSLSQGEASRLINKLTDDDMVLIMRRNKPVAILSKVLDPDNPRPLKQGIIDFPK